MFESLDQVREISAAWMREYNKERPHDTLDGMPPSAFLAHQTIGSCPLSVSMTGEFTVLLEHQGLKQEGEGSGDNASSELSPEQNFSDRYVVVKEQVNRSNHGQPFIYLEVSS